MATPSQPADRLEALIQAQGKALADAAKADDSSFPEQWLQQLLQRINRDKAFRIAALRFIDVLPALQNDAQLVAIYREYFADIGFPVPALGRLLKRAGEFLPDVLLARSVRKVTRILAKQFMGGEDAREVSMTLRKLQSQGLSASLDLVGEVSLSNADARAYQQSYRQLLETLCPGEPLHLSIKLSSLYPRMVAQNVHGSVAGVMPMLCPILDTAMARGAEIVVDMEDYDKRHLVMAVFCELLMDQRYRDWQGLGIAIQSYLRESEADLRRLLDLARQRNSPFLIRLVRGAYWDQEVILAKQHGWPVPVWQRQAQTDRQFEHNLQLLLAAAPLVRTAVATHNPRSLAAALAMVDLHGLETSQYEFQMLYGMTPQLQQGLLRLQRPLRIYVPFGDAIPGMAYLVRRLLENASSQSLRRLQGGEAGLVTADFAAPDSDAVSPAAVESPRPHFQNQPAHRFTSAQESADLCRALAEVEASLGQHRQLLIDGRWQDGGPPLQSFNPARPEQLIGSVATTEREQLDRALASARRASPGWAAVGVQWRAELLRRAAEKLTQRRDEFAAWEIFEAGKNWTEADADICEAIDFLRFYADEAERLAQPGGIELAGESNLHGYRPYGIAAIIPPWNFPLAILVGMLSAALVSGNCALLKPASDTPVVAARFVELLQGLGLPPGVLGFVPGRGDVVGEYLVSHPDVQLVAFTGSLAVGQRILQHSVQLAEGQRQFKQVIAELGGKNAIIVDASADPDQAVAGIVQSAFGFQGQKCSACSRVIVVGGLYESLVARIVEASASLVMADPTDPACDLGPVINATAARRIRKMVEQEGQRASLVYQGDVLGVPAGHYLGPTIFRDVDPDCRLAQEEIFGPVLALMPAPDFDQALQIANATRYALTGGVYSRSPANLALARREFMVGNLYLNRGITGALVTRQPFGGHRLSGTGSRAGGRDYLQHFMQAHCVTENTLRRGFAPKPGS